ncbi:dienelactone hydrolase family protein [Niastella caeni]|uniref:Dienelactone hydrolase family protein n=1 Tax=Niastella caeni TaxID=2569763 RepID=A0A4S8HM02_9BACT|nr:dienelactone hydrolase family protein [Niastella caeni]THU34804.1 dienelactone hydrolase family protein [Niastella caeni]
MKHKLGYVYLFIAVAAIVSCNDQSSKQTGKEAETKKPGIKEMNISYGGDDITMDGFVAYDTSVDTKRPAILVIHEWWGLNDYPKMRARELAKLGYIAMAMDMYGNGLTTDSPSTAGKLATPFYTNPEKAKARIDAALVALKSYMQTDTSKIAAIGYCFGGGMVLNAARLGEPFKGVVSFHGSLLGTPANKDLLKAKILVCHGADDPFVKKEEVDQFKKQMDSIQADYTFKAYPGAVHAFTNPKATEVGKQFNIPIAYNAAADSASWRDMQEFFNRIFK